MNGKRQKEITEQIWRELSDRLRRFVRSRVSSETDVDDILQTVFLRIHTGFSSLRAADRLESWVFQITRNAISDHYRKRRDLQDDTETPVEDPDSTDTKNVNTEIAECIKLLIDRLPEDQKRALSMYEQDGISQKIIADRESISVSGAKSRIQRGRKSVEAMLKACCELQFDGRGNILEYKTDNTDCCDDECG